MLRWQRIGTTSHALDSDHQFVAGEIFRALCGDRFAVGDGDVHPYTPKPLLPLCEECRAVWTDMQAQPDEVTSVRVDNNGNTYEPEEDPAVVLREDSDKDQDQEK